MRTLISSGWHTAFLRGFTSLSLAFPGVIMAQETIPEETVSIDTLADTLSRLQPAWILCGCFWRQCWYFLCSRDLQWSKPDLHVVRILPTS